MQELQPKLIPYIKPTLLGPPTRLPHDYHVMKSIPPHFLSLYTAALAVLAKINSAQQEVLISENIMAQQDKIPGHNNAVYDIVPKEDQIFSVEFLEIVPTPIIA